MASSTRTFDEFICLDVKILFTQMVANSRLIETIVFYGDSNMRKIASSRSSITASTKLSCIPVLLS